MAKAHIDDSRSIEKTSPPSDPSEPEIARHEDVSGQSRGNQPTDAELERGILDAVKLGLGPVAKTLAAQLEGRQRATAGNVTPIDAAKRRGR